MFGLEVALLLNRWQCALKLRDLARAVESERAEKAEKDPEINHSRSDNSQNHKAE